MNKNQNQIRWGTYLRHPSAWAYMKGSASYPDIRGDVTFYETPYGVLAAVELMGLPFPFDPCRSTPVFGFHIHEGGSCTGNAQEAFIDAGAHYNPRGCPHPYHAGDLPPLFGVDGRAFAIFLTGRFTVREIIGKTIILHSMPDDFHTQPAGNAGEKIACGAITG
jgi:Cu-Zn family superoxide dismutase